MTDPDTIDLENRDPNGINSKLGVLFEEVLAEPDGAHSIDCVWKNSYKCYTCGISCCYKFMTCLCGLCIALYWGCVFACIAFDYIWCITPGCRVFEMGCSLIRKFIDAILNSVVAPCCNVCGLCCRITIVKPD